MSKFYITTTLPYINSDPHLGFAKEIINADVIARYKKQRGFEVFFNTGTDEHGKKIKQKADELGVDILEYCSKYSQKFLDLQEALNLGFDSFIRTTDEAHVRAVAKFWQKCLDNGDIYKKKYKIKYCVGCEMEKTDSDLEKDVCPFHPNLEIETIEEENYFFKFSNYQKKLLQLYENNPNFVRSKGRFNEIINFVKSGLNDFSISRLKEKMPWGIAVPGDDSQVVYVWFDALINYISCLGWPDNLEKFNNFWPGIQVCGKDNLRQQTAMWPAMLMSAGLPVSDGVLVFGFLTINGQKISKSLGNAINPLELVQKYHPDIVRYYLVKEISTFEDGDFSYEKLEKLYSSDLVNGLGNLVARVSNLIEKEKAPIKLKEIKRQEDVPLLPDQANNSFFIEIEKKMDEYKLNEALSLVSSKIKEVDEFLSHQAPWKMESGEDKNAVLQKASENILDIALAIYPFTPVSADKIIKQFTSEKIIKGDVLFPRLVN
jgi:methionyl-tRNA synthetase